MISDEEQAGPAVRSVHQLCSLPDRDFVTMAYRLVLGREADPVGERQFTDQLRRGMAKTEILYALRSSPEGRAWPVELPGLKRKMAMVRLFQAPIFRRLGIPRAGQYSNSASARSKRRLENDVARLSRDVGQIASSLADLADRVSRIDQRMVLLETEGPRESKRRGSGLSVEQLLGLFK